MIKARILAAAAVVAAAPVLLPATQAFAATTHACGLCSALTSSTGSSSSTSTTPSVAGAGSESATGQGADSVNSAGELPLAPFDSTQTLEGEQDVFIKGGQDLGRGAGELVSSAYIGGPQGILDIPAHVLGWPKPLGYINEG